MIKNLTIEQEKIVKSLGVPMKVLAGPGTGKTSCIIERIRFLLKNKKISYTKICVITFTRTAAAELREKLEKSDINSATLPYVNTLHGLAISILKKYYKKTGLKLGFRPVSNIFNKILIADVIQELKQKGIVLSFDNQKTLKDAYFRNKAKAGLPKILSSNPRFNKALEKFSISFQEHLEFYNAIDWEDALWEAIKLIDSYPLIKSEIHNKTEYFLVDEYQDLSPLEQYFIDKVSGSLNGLCVVGDDDQSIYETFRFAAPLGLVNFIKKYPTAKDFPISICWRCPAEIIRCALSLITNNKRRAKKNLFPCPKKKKGFVIIHSNKSKKEEMKWLVSRVLDIRKKQGFDYKDIMILFVDGDIAKDYIEALKVAGIPLNIQLKIAKIFDSKDFLGLASLIKWLINNDDNLNLRHFLYYWKGIGSETARQLRLHALSIKGSLWEAVKNVAKNPNAFKVIKQRKKIIECCEYLRNIKKIEKFPNITDNFFTTFPESKQDKGCEAFRERLNSFIGKEQLITLKEIHDDFEQKIESGELESKYKKEEKGIRVMTVHSAKGCESPIVIIPALEEDIIPGKNKNVEEQRRLFYVSITRAEEGLYLSWAGQRAGQEIHKVPGRKRLGKEESRFLKEMMVI